MSKVLTGLWRAWLGLGMLIFSVVILLPALTPLIVTVITGSSMGKAVPKGSLVLSKPTASVTKGSIILFKREDEFVAHRVTNVMRTESGMAAYEVQGDANTKPDAELVTPSQVQSKAIFIMPHLGLLTHNAGAYLFLGAGGMLALTRLFTKDFRALLVLPMAAILILPPQFAHANFSDTADIKGAIFKAAELEAPVIKCGAVTLLTAAFNWPKIAAAESYTVFYNGGKETLTVKTNYIGGIVVLGAAKQIYVTANYRINGRLYRSAPSNQKKFYSLLVGVCVDDTSPVVLPKNPLK